MIYALLGIAAAFCAFIQWGDELPLPKDDLNAQNSKYILEVKKQDEKEKFEKNVFHRTASGYMTVEEYEMLSAPKDRMTMEIDVPKVPTPADMVYVPQPSYKIVKYNNPPGSFEISLNNSFYKRRQQNVQGIVSPDFTRLVYPSVYYYPNSGSTACDLFVIKLDDAKNTKDKILTANIVHRMSEPILSTDKNNDNYYTFRTLTPVDFSQDGRKLLVKEKIGNTKDGIWKTTPIVYDFENKVSYNLSDIREAITYYWHGKENLYLDDKRWDIYPLGFGLDNTDWVIVKALAYTGQDPVFLGFWAINSNGESPRLLSLDNNPENVGMNGYKLVKEGVEVPYISEDEAKNLKNIEKQNAKKKQKEEKAEIKEMEKSYKAKIKELDAEFKEEQKDYKLRQKIQGSTSDDEALKKYEEIKATQEAKKQAKEQKRLEKLKQKELKELEKLKQTK